jgi:tRNA(Ile)-lysidine synthase
MPKKLSLLFNQHILSLLRTSINNPLVATKPRFVVGLSGGVDSIVLLHLLVALQKKMPEIGVVAHNVNHGLSKNADNWGYFCADFCQKLEVPLIASKVNIEKKSSASIEALAREARYTCFKKEMQSGDVILTGHHQDDQLETVLLALKRGSGSAGLQGVHAVQPFSNGYLLRPLLIFSRQQIVDYAQYHELQWIEDESNLDIVFDRNFIREKVSPVLMERWPFIAKAVSRTALLCQEQQSLLNEVAEQDLQLCLGSHFSQPTLDILKLSHLSEARRNNALRHWLKSNGLQYPSHKQLAILWHEVALAESDKQPLLQLEANAIRRYQGLLYIVSEQQMDLPINPIKWCGEDKLSLLEDKLIVDFSQVDRGIASRHDIQCCFRQHLESSLTCLPIGRDKARTVKKLLHEYQVPPWLRDLVVFVLVDGQLVQAIDLWHCQQQLLLPLTLTFSPR